MEERGQCMDRSAGGVHMNSFYSAELAYCHWGRTAASAHTEAIIAVT